jgi:hypothetical protein
MVKINQERREMQIVKLKREVQIEISNVFNSSLNSDLATLTFEKME